MGGRTFSVAAGATASLVGLTFADPHHIAQRIMELGAWQQLGFVLLHVGATALGIPGTVLVVAGGVLFGVVWGTFWSLLGATLGAVAAFVLARYCLGGWCRRRLLRHPQLRRLDRQLQGQGFWYVLAIRFAPISPFNLVNFLLGLTSVSLGSYTLGTGLGIIPGTLAYTWLGAAGLQAFRGDSWLPLAGALTLLTTLSLCPLVLRRRRSRGLCLRRSSSQRRP